MLWALEVPGVTRCWVDGNGWGAGTVVVYPMLDQAQAAHGGFPQGSDGCATEEDRGPTATGDQLAVANHLWTVQPVTALVYVAAAVPLPVDVTLVLLDPDTQDTRDAILGSLQDMFLIEAQVGGVIYPSQLYEAILTAPGVNHFTMTAPVAPVQAASGQLPVMGTLTVA